MVGRSRQVSMLLNVFGEAAYGYLTVFPAWMLRVSFLRGALTALPIVLCQIFFLSIGFALCQMKPKHNKERRSVILFLEKILNIDFYYLFLIIAHFDLFINYAQC
jgi:hypothetical protein